MRKSYHLSPDDLREMIKDYFSKNGETVTSCSFEVGKRGGDYPQTYEYHEFSECVVYIEDTNIKKEKNGI